MIFIPGNIKASRNPGRGTSSVPPVTLLVVPATLLAVLVTLLVKALVGFAVPSGTSLATSLTTLGLLIVTFFVTSALLRAGMIAFSRA